MSYCAFDKLIPYPILKVGNSKGLGGNQIRRFFFLFKA